MPTEVITTTYNEVEFRELLKSVVVEAVREEINRVLDRPNNPPSTKEFYTLKETANILGVSLTTLHSRINEGFLERRRVGRKVLFKWEDIQKAMRTYSEKTLDKREDKLIYRPAKRR